MTLQIPVINDQDSAGSVDVAEQVFGQLFNETLVHQLVTLNIWRARVLAQKRKKSLRCQWRRYKAFSSKRNRSCRAGTTRGPIWRTGGVTFAADRVLLSKNSTKKCIKWESAQYFLNC
jgi:large subunit ribosomal protein L4